VDGFCVLLQNFVQIGQTVKVEGGGGNEKSLPPFSPMGGPRAPNFFYLRGLVGPYLSSKHDVPPVKIGVRGGTSGLKKFFVGQFGIGRSLLACITYNNSAYCVKHMTKFIKILIVHIFDFRPRLGDTAPQS